MTKEFRAASIEPASDEDLTLTGRPIVYDVPTVINEPDGTSYIEIIAHGALDDADLSDSTLIYNHDQTRVPLARTPRTMTLTRDDFGLSMVAKLAGDNQTSKEVYSAVKRGDLSGMSFAFTVPDGGSRYDPVTNTRTITAIAKVYEVSVVPFPAYQATSVEARSAIQQARNTEEERKRLIIWANQLQF